MYFYIQNPENHTSPLYVMKKQEKPDTLVFINTYNFKDRQTHKQTGGHGDSMTDGAQRVESVKIIFITH